MKHLQSGSLFNIGIHELSRSENITRTCGHYERSTRIMCISGHGTVLIDLAEIRLAKVNILFLSRGQLLRIKEGRFTAVMLNYTGAQANDDELYEPYSGDMVFGHLFEFPLTGISAVSFEALRQLLLEIKSEMAYQDAGYTQMIQVLHRLFMLRADREWRKKYRFGSSAIQPPYLFRERFGTLVEQYYHKHHDVAAYAQMLNITTSCLSRRLTGQGGKAAGTLIRNRILLEAKRKLIHSPFSVKEIAFELGYTDPSYFIRFFTKQAGMPPQDFRRNFNDMAIQRSGLPL